MERYTMFLDWKNQHCENDYTTQSNLKIQCNRYQITNDIFQKTETNKTKNTEQTNRTQNKKFYNLHGNIKDPE